MPPEDRDLALLLDMLGYAEEAAAIVEGLGYEAFTADRMRILALERAALLLGEAARRVTMARRLALPEIPWHRLIGQRDVLAEDARKIDHFQLFRTAREEFPRLISVLHTLVR